MHHNKRGLLLKWGDGTGVSAGSPVHPDLLQHIVLSLNEMKHYSLSAVDDVGKKIKKSWRIQIAFANLKKIIGFDFIWCWWPCM
jgi:hypothetical protein